MSITVRGNSRDLSNFGAGGDIFLVLLEIVDHSLDSRLGTSSQIHRVAASGHVLDGLGEDSRGKDGSSGGTVTSNFVRLGGDILNQASTKVLEFILESDGFCDSNTIYA